MYYYAHRLRGDGKRMLMGNTVLAAEVEIDETYVGGKGTDKATLQGFVADTVAPGSTVYTDEHPAYKGMVNIEHETVKHSVGKYVREQAHTNGIESFWSMLKASISAAITG